MKSLPISNAQLKKRNLQKIISFKKSEEEKREKERERNEKKNMPWPISCEKLWRLALSNAWQVIKPIFIQSTITVGGSVIPNCFTSENENNYSPAKTTLVTASPFKCQT